MRCATANRQSPPVYQFLAITKTAHVANLHGRLQRAKPEDAGLAPRTIDHVHRLMHRVFGHAVKWRTITNNPVASAEHPCVQRTETQILAPDEIRTGLAKLRGRRMR